MENNTSGVDYNSLKPLLTEFEGMRNTLSNFVKLIKQQNERIEVLERKLENIPEPTLEQVVLDRFTESSKRNRSLNAKPEAIAYAAHLYFLKQIPAIRITECGVLSQSKMYGLTSWDTQHLIDFCDINGVSDIYNNGLDDEHARELVKDLGKLKSYLQRDGKANVDTTS